MSEAFPSAVGRLQVSKYIDQIQDELAKIAKEIGPGKSQKEIDDAQARIQILLRKQSQQIAKEIGISGNHVFLFMIGSTILTTAWASFYIKMQMEDISKSVEERLALTDMLSSLYLALENIIASSTSYAEIYGKK